MGAYFQGEEKMKESRGREGRAIRERGR